MYGVAADDSPNWLTLRETEVAESDQDCIVFLVECSVEKISKRECSGDKSQLGDVCSRRQSCFRRPSMSRSLWVKSPSTDRLVLNLIR